MCRKRIVKTHKKKGMKKYIFIGFIPLLPSPAEKPVSPKKLYKISRGKVDDPARN